MNLATASATLPWPPMSDAFIAVAAFVLVLASFWIASRLLFNNRRITGEATSTFDLDGGLARQLDPSLIAPHLIDPLLDFRAPVQVAPGPPVVVPQLPIAAPGSLSQDNIKVHRLLLANLVNQRQFLSEAERLLPVPPPDPYTDSDEDGPYADSDEDDDSAQFERVTTGDVAEFGLLDDNETFGTVVESHEPAAVSQTKRTLA